MLALFFVFEWSASHGRGDRPVIGLGYFLAAFARLVMLWITVAVGTRWTLARARVVATALLILVIGFNFNGERTFLVLALAFTVLLLGLAWGFSPWTPSQRLWRAIGVFVMTPGLQLAPIPTAAPANEIPSSPLPATNLPAEKASNRILAGNWKLPTRRAVPPWALVLLTAVFALFESTVIGGERLEAIPFVLPFLALASTMLTGFCGLIGRLIACRLADVPIEFVLIGAWRIRRSPHGLRIGRIDSYAALCGHAEIAPRDTPDIADRLVRAELGAPLGVAVATAGFLGLLGWSFAANGPILLLHGLALLAAIGTGLIFLALVFFQWRQFRRTMTTDTAAS